MPARQTKRPYAGSQPQITSYFTTGSTSLPAPPNPSQNQPALPHPVQSSLLSVGMRIRKSVPEGYKTGSYSAFNLFSDTTPAIKSNISSAPPASNPTPGTHKVTRPHAGNRELTPFCGLMKVGGLGIQGYSDSGEAIEDGDEDEYEETFWGSQESMMSNDSVGSYGGGNGAKRRFTDEDEDCGDLFGGNENEGRVLMNVGDRRIAVPRMRKSEKSSVGGMTTRFGGDENADFDFGEADFLDYSLAEEVQMGGV
ncbi:hypothetical protein DID88_002907 [Monilinia fructigena]|uniref:Uncharacterized protein n=1 Tax=Monilinia fructigena TaxID=38457 RepID=A0A395IPN1_9HELO|nr:hypothetical protein DID88_002907 [Monilinia fructigena]